ncbi:hypothetical protein PORY_002564 [Pneumocystis oryctolagi]|uniref:Uncharacterized protein n=1 Tax=Pneumocystis oryctolagi TaxID=42067 RepID=A0ACB7C917_9ASCO|nr:hypothetical protein PORY_002564 [Pneumocystis oryctolagi]
MDPPVYRQPVELFCFSYDECRTLRHDTFSLKYYYPAMPGADLSYGFEKRIERDETVDEHLDGFLLSLCEYERTQGCAHTSVDILTWRGILTRFLCTPYDRHTSWAVHIVRFQVKFIEDCHVPPPPLTMYEALMCFWGHKFEVNVALYNQKDLFCIFVLFIFTDMVKVLSTLPDTWDKCSREQIEQRNENVVNNNVQYCAAVRTKLDEVTLLIAGEVDCAWDVKPSPPENPIPLYVELKTTFANRSVFERVPRVIVGFRTEDGRLIDIEMYETHTLLSRARRSRDGTRALAWTAALLRFLRKNCIDDVSNETISAPSTAWTLSYTPGDTFVRLERVKKQCFLHPHFVSHRMQSVSGETIKSSEISS